MSSLNKAMIIGRLGQDPDVRQTNTGDTVANLSVATSYKTKDTEHTEWHRVTVFGKLADIVSQYLKKGSQAYFEGRLQTRKWQDKDGQDRYTTEIVATQMVMLGGKSDGNDSQQHSRPVQEKASEPVDDETIPF